MATIIQIKRSTGGGAPTTGTLSEAELAYSQDKSNEGANAILYIESVASDNSPVIHKVGGKYYTDIIDAASTEASANTLVKRYANGSIGANVVYASELVGNITGTVTGVAESAQRLQNARTITLNGDLEGAVSFDGSTDVTIYANVINNSVELGTDTTGDYVENVSAGTGITVSGFSGEGQTISVALENTAVTPGTYGGHSTVGTFTVDQQGRITTAANADIVLALGTDTTGDYVQNVVAGTGITVTGFSGESQDLTVALDASGVVATTYGGSTNIPVLVVDTYGRITSASNASISTSFGLTGDSGSDTLYGGDVLAFVGAAGLVTAVSDNTITFTNTGVTNLDGTAGEISLTSTTGNITASLATSGVTAGLYGNGKVIPSLTVDSKGRLTLASNVNIDLNGLTTNAIPSVNGVLNLGSNDKRFSELWLAGQTIYLGNIALQDNNGQLAVSELDGSGAIVGSAFDLASNVYVDARLATKANVVDLTLEIAGDGASSNVVNLYNDTLTFSGDAPGSYVSVGAGGAVTVYNTGVTELTSSGHGIVASSSTGNVALTFTGVGAVQGTSNEIEVSAATGNVQIGLPNDVTIQQDLTVNRDLVVSGNLYVTGNTVSVGASNLNIEDPLIHLANNNTSSDVVDIGFEGHYYDATFGNRHTGLFRDASDNGKYKLFSNVAAELEGVTTIDTTNAGFTIATLVANLEGGTVSGLASAIGVADGGTGRTSLTANAVLYGNGTGPVSLATGTSGQILQINSDGMVAFGDIDGGTY